jgi:pimeloyl-ACP methyl ester carboxylesterase
VRSWRFPILYIGGEWETPQWHRVADSVTAWLPNARKLVIPGGGHAVHFDEPSAFNAALLAFIKGVESERSRRPR